MSKIQAALFAVAASLACTGAVSAAAPPEVRLTIRGHRFVPVDTVVPANTKVRLIVVNEDPTPEEFESHELNREKVVTGGGTISVYVGPLKPGRYPFFGDFHAEVARGTLLAR